MYGQKQILQCLAVAIILAVFNFHRAAINRNKEVSKHKLMTKKDSDAKIRINENKTAPSLNGHNYVSYDIDSSCRRICLINFQTWIRVQCPANCNIYKNVINNAYCQDSKDYRSQMTRNHENMPIKNDENGASQLNKHYELVKIISEPLNEKLMSKKKGKHKQQVIESECKIQSADELICKNTTSNFVDFLKLKTNKSHIVMEYNDILFEMGTPPVHITSPKTIFYSGSFQSTLIAFISFIAVMVTVRFMIKFLITDHTEAFIRALEMRRQLQLQLDQIQAELNQNQQNDTSNNGSTNERNGTVNNADQKNDGQDEE